MSGERVSITFVAHAMTTAQHEARFPSPDDGLGRVGILHCRRATLPPPRGKLLLSPSRAARETAIELGWGGSPEAAEEPLLREQHPGTWQGHTLDGLDLAEIVAWRGGAAPPGGESRRELRHRVQTLLERLPAGETTAVVPQSVLRCAMAIALGAADSSFWRIEAEPLAALSLRRRAGDEWGIHLSPRPVPWT